MIPAVLHGLPLAQADFVEGLFQLVVLALFLAGPLIARGLKALADRAGGQEASEGRAEPRRPRSEAEESGRDIWRQLMELEEVEEPPPRRTARRPQDPLHDPDVERVEDDALRRRRRRAAAEASAPVEAPAPKPTPKPAPAPPRPRTAHRASETPAHRASETIVSMEGLESVLPRVPDEGTMERIDADARRRHPLADLGSDAVGGAGSAFAGLGSAAFTSLSSAAAPSSVGRAAARRTALGRPSRAALRRAVLWSEVLGPPVSMRDAACGGRGPTQS